ncbi:MAG: hypothetical protein IT269_02900, partial [Saprospiraceae bacterium]|nr:hypothetical protein [Saprospiraceae bacterium]
MSFFFAFCLGDILAQAKYNYNWLLGYYSTGPDSEFGGSLLDFNFQPVKVSYRILPNVGETRLSSLSDSLGQFRIYFDGCSLYDVVDNTILPNGADINIGTQRDMYCEGVEKGYPLQLSFFLPRPEKPEIIDLIHHSLGNELFNGSEILYTTIDLAQNNGQGAIVNKNQALITDDTINPYMAAVRHANGKDWWVVIPTAELDLISGVHIVKWTKDGPSAPKYQELGPYAYATATQAAFSPDGTKYCFFASGLVVLADFDRSTGTLYNIRTWSLYDSGPLEAFGVAFSPNSRFLYLSTSVRIRQYDLQANDLGASAVIIGGIENSSTSLQYTCTRMQLAPDGQIYVTQYL